MHYSSKGVAVITLILTTSLLLMTIPSVIASSVGSNYCLSNHITLTEVVKVGNGYLEVKINVSVKGVKEGLNVSIYTELLGLKGIKEINYTPPLMDFIVITDKGTFRWSKGKFFIQAYLKKELPLRVRNSLLVKGKCVRALVIIIKPIGYLRIVGTLPPQLITSLSMRQPSPPKAVAVTKLSSGPSNYTTTTASVKAVPQCTVGVLPPTTSSTTKTIPTKAGIEEVTKTVTPTVTTTLTTKAKVTKTSPHKALTTTASPPCEGNVCRAPLPSITPGLTTSEKEVGVNSVAGIKGGSTVVKSLTTSSTSVTPTAGTHYVGTETHYLIFKVGRVLIAVVVATTVAIITYVLLYRRS